MLAQHSMHMHSYTYSAIVWCTYVSMYVCTWLCTHSLSGRNLALNWQWKVVPSVLYESSSIADAIQSSPMYVHIHVSKWCNTKLMYIYFVLLHVCTYLLLGSKEEPSQVYIPVFTRGRFLVQKMYSHSLINNGTWSLQLLGTALGLSTGPASKLPLLEKHSSDESSLA